MRTILILIAGFILINMALVAIGPIIILGIGATIIYYSYKGFMTSRSVMGKLWWGIAALIGGSIVLGASPALIGVGAIAILYYGFKELKKPRRPISATTYDYSEFQSFENEWDDMMQKHK